MSRNCLTISSVFAATLSVGLVSCIQKSKSVENKAGLDFAARGKDATLLVTPVRLPPFTKTSKVSDQSRGFVRL